MNHQEALERVVQLAVKTYDHKTHLDVFASEAASIIAQCEAAEHDQDASQAAVIFAVSSMNDALNFASHFAAVAADEQDKKKGYRSKPVLRSRSDDKASSKSTGFVQLVDDISKEPLDKEILALYQSKFQPSSHANALAALSAARDIYPHAFASARTAYVYASVRAKSDPDLFRKHFAKEWPKRLDEPLDPGFLLRIFCSDAMKVCGVVVLIAGLSLLSLGIIGLAIASLGIALATTIGVTATALTVAGGVASATSTGGLMSQFFSVNQLKKENKARFDAVREINRSDSDLPTPIPTAI